MTNESKLRLDDGESIRFDENGLSPAFFCKKNSALIDTALIASLKAASEQRGNAPVRVCLHADPSDSLHDMIVLIPAGGYYPPHKHIQKSESYHLIEGRAAMVLFDDDGKIIDWCVLDSQTDFLYRVGKGLFHTMIPLSGILVYHEARPGPFLATGDSVFPQWAPSRENRAEGVRFMQETLKKIGMSA